MVVLPAGFPAVERKRRQSSLTFKALLLSLGFSWGLENVKICFLPPNTTSLIQSMGQGGVLTFKADFLKWTLGQPVDAATGDHVTLAEFGERRVTKHAIKNIKALWQEIKWVIPEQ